MTTSQIPVAFSPQPARLSAPLFQNRHLSTEPPSIAEHVIRYLAGSDRFDKFKVEEEQIISPAFDVEVRPHRYLITVRLPDFRADEVAVAVTSREVIIYGRHSLDDSDLVVGLCSQSFSKSLLLPKWIDIASAHATFGDGKLQLSFWRTLERSGSNQRMNSEESLNERLL